MDLAVLTLHVPVELVEYAGNAQEPHECERHTDAKQQHFQLRQNKVHWRFPSNGCAVPLLNGLPHSPHTTSDLLYETVAVVKRHDHSRGRMSLKVLQGDVHCRTARAWRGIYRFALDHFAAVGCYIRHMVAFLRGCVSEFCGLPTTLVREAYVLLNLMG